jgi:LuxR family glucitol operon transcriptional activator
MNKGHYSEALQLWKNILKTYTQIQGRHISRIGFWNDRLIWSTWLMQMAEQRGDWPTATEIMLDRAWTLITIGKPNHLKVADRLLNQAWNWRQHQTLPFQTNLAKTRAILAIQRSEFAAAQAWIMEATTLLEQAQLPESEHLRQAIQLQYYQGELWFKIGDYPQAKQCFETALEQAQQLNSTRTTAMIQNWLADIAIEQGDFQKAHTLLMEGLRLAEMNHDRTRIAYCQRSIAHLHQAQQDFEQAMRWATSALEQFEALNMIPEVEETQSLLERISGAH